MKKKLVSILLAATMITGGLAGCGSEAGSTQTPDANESVSSETAASEATPTSETPQAEKTEEKEAASEEPITLRMAWWGSQDRHDKTIAAIELYESLNPNVTF